MVGSLLYVLPWYRSSVRVCGARADTNLSVEDVSTPPDVGFWHGWKVEEYCSLMDVDDESGPIQKKAAMTHYNKARNRPCFGYAQPEPPAIMSLPRELLDSIVILLDPIAEMCFRVSCQRFYAECGTCSHTNLVQRICFDRDPAASLNWKYRQDWCPGFHHIPSRRLFCHKCDREHCRSYFNEEQAQRMPTARVCNGRLRPLKISPEVDIYFVDLERTWKRQQTMVPIEFNHYTEEQLTKTSLAKTIEGLVGFSSSSYGDVPH